MHVFKVIEGMLEELMGDTQNEWWLECRTYGTPSKKRVWVMNGSFVNSCLFAEPLLRNIRWKYMSK